MSNRAITQKLPEARGESALVVVNDQIKVAKPVVARGGVDRKFVQKVKAEVEQQERQLARAIVTALATCSLIVAWMLMAQTDAQAPAMLRSQPTAVVQVVTSPPSQPEIIPTVYVVNQSILVPTLVADQAQQGRQLVRP